MKTIVFLAAAALAAPVSAATVVELETFDVTFDGSDPVTKGFSYQQSLAYASSDALYLHDDFGVTRSTIRSVEGRRFDAVEADVLAYSNVYVTGSNPRPEDPDEAAAWHYSRKHAFNNFAWYGYRDGAVVARYEGFIDEPEATFRPFAFGEEFRDLDALEARLLVPEAEVHFWPDILRSDTIWCEEWCAGFKVDRLALAVDDAPTPAPVPLPPAGLLLVAGLGFAFAARRASAAKSRGE